MVLAAADAYGTVNILVNDAAAFVFGEIEDITDADWGQVPGRGVRVRHPDCTAQAAADCVSGASCSASCFVVTPGVR